MAVKKRSSAGVKAKTVSVYLYADEIQERRPVLLFTAGQIDEVLTKAEIQAVPFASEYLLGLCAWREQVLPIMDLVRFFGLSSSGKDEGARYLVVRTVDTLSPGSAENIHSEKVLQRCVLKVSDQIINGDIPADCEVIYPKQAGFAPVFVRGLFRREKELFILPDIAAIIHSNSLGGAE
ncbi:Chemotaxis signal transduction protein [Candidatus Electrothrix marina]|uniref:Chemotaxis signal transduction protein n=1 Tax=Candidatus Electrothrix marina TaxID=1859130 RepID=A0A444JHI7_9BACT|nr:Chemotaxis signal transduction protein [Candidatus Electrothrix marina]